MLHMTTADDANVEGKSRGGGGRRDEANDFARDKNPEREPGLDNARRHWVSCMWSIYPSFSLSLPISSTKRPFFSHVKYRRPARFGSREPLLTLFYVIHSVPCIFCRARFRGNSVRGQVAGRCSPSTRGRWVWNVVIWNDPRGERKSRRAHNSYSIGQKFWGRVFLRKKTRVIQQYLFFVQKFSWIIHFREETVDQRHLLLALIWFHYYFSSYPRENRKNWVNKLFDTNLRVIVTFWWILFFFGQYKTVDIASKDRETIFFIELFYSSSIKSNWQNWWLPRRVKDENCKRTFAGYSLRMDKLWISRITIPERIYRRCTLWIAR